MNINTTFPSKFLKASDLAGTTPTVTISHVSVEEVGRQKESLPVVYFAGKEKGCVLNKTNGRMIASIAGTDETDEWVGVAVQLYTAMVEFQGESVEAIRVRAPKKAAPKPVPVPKGKAKPVAVEPEMGTDASDDPTDDDVIAF